MSDKLNILTLNVRGFNEKTKRRDIFQWIRHQKASIVVLQEIHGEGANTDTWEKEWGGKIILSKGSNNSRGVAILFTKKLNFQIDSVYKDSQGRIVIVNGTNDNKGFSLCGVYAPNESVQRKNFFSNLTNIIDEYCIYENLVLAGDFNCAINRLDRISHSVSVDKSVNSLRKLLNHFGLVDIWRQQHPNLQQFTWRRLRPNPIHSRIDYIFIVKHLVNSVKKVDIRPALKTDHMAVYFELVQEKNDRGPGTWKFNNYLLKKEDYVSSIRNVIGSCKIKYANLNAKVKWDLTKKDIKEFTTVYSHNATKNSNRTIVELEKQLCSAENI